MKKSSKKFIALLLSAIMLVTSIPLGAFIASAADGDAKDKYLFAYFTGDQPEKQKVRFAVSEDGYNYKAINKGAAVITQNLGTKSCRDPYIFEGQNGEYYVICTDMDASYGWTGTGVSMVIWKSVDLINWTDETIIDMPTMIGESVKYCWAPQVIWDSSYGTDGAYMIYFTLGAVNYTNDKQVLYYCHATNLLDVNTWTKPQLLYAPASGNPAIDGDIFYNSKDSTYYLYYKDEDNKTICYVTSSNITGPWSESKKVLNVDVAIEGANCFIPNGSDKIVMVADAYTSGYFVVAESTDYKNFTILDQSQYSVNHLSPRHGSIINITSAQYDALVDAYGIVDTTEVSYDFTDGFSGTPTGWFYTQPSHADSTGWAYDVMSHGGSFSATNGKCKIVTCNLFINEDAARNMVMSDSWTISFTHTLDDATKAATTMLAVGNAEQDFVRLTCDGTFTVNGTAAANKANVVTGVENAYIITYDGQAVSLYQNGALVASVQTTLNVSKAANGSLYIGVGYSDTNSSASYTTSTYGSLRISPKSIDSEYTLGELLDLMNEFKKMLSKGTLYKNMGNAYDAYVKCQKAYDAYYYGGDESVDLTAAATALRVDMLSMVKWEIPTADSRPSFAEGTVPDSAYANLLYSNRRNSYAAADFTYVTNSWYTWPITYTCKTHVQVGYNETVMLYDGVTQPKIPVMAFTDYENAAGGKRNHYLYSFYPDTADLYLADQWHSDGGDAWNFSDRYNGTNRVGHNADTFVSGPNLRDENWHGYSNILLFDSNVSWGDTYYKTYKNLSWTAYAGESSTPNKDHVGSGAVNDNSTIYVINYKPLRENIVDNLKYLTNVSNYSEGGLSDLFKAYDIATAVNLNEYDYSNDTANVVSTVAGKIANAVAAFPTKELNDDSSAYKALRTAIDTYRATGENANACPKYVTALGGAILTAQNAMAAVDDDSGNNYKADYNSKNIGEIASDLNTAVTDYKNSVHVYSWDSYDKTTGKVTFKCSSCEDSYQLEGQNYMTAAMIYDTLDKSKYTSDAIEAIERAKRQFDRIKTSRQAEKYSQLDIDDVTTDLIEAMNSPLNKEDTERKWFVVTHIVVEDGVQVSTSKHDKRYGDTVSINYIPSNGVITSWDVQVGSSPVKTVATDVNDYMLYVQDDTVITTYVRKNTTSTYVNILDQYGKVLYSIPAKADDVITCNGNTVTIAGNPYNVPNMPYMNVTEYTVNGVKYTSETEFKVKAGENKIVPKYDPVVSDYTITADGADVTVNGKATNKAEYDDVVTVTFPEGTYAVAIQNSDVSYAVAAYGNTYTFFANRNMTFYAVNGSASNYTIGTTALDKDKDALTIHRLDYQLPFAYSEVTCTDTEANKYTTFSSYSMEVPAGVTILEKGTLVSKTAGLTDETFRIGMDGVSQAVNANTAKYGNQYSLSIRNGGSVTTRAYVKYTYTYQGKEITAVSYGNICNAQ